MALRVPTAQIKGVGVQGLQLPSSGGHIPAAAFGDGGAAMRAAGQGLQQIAQGLSALAAADSEAKLQEAGNRMSEWELATLHDPDAGVFGKRGKDALGLTDTVDAAYRQKAAEISASFGDNGLAQRFQQTIQERRLVSLKAVARHETVERRTYYGALEDDTARKAENAALLAYTDRDMAQESLDSAAAYLRQNLSGRDDVDRRVGDMYSTSVSSIVLRHLADGSVDDARKFYAANRRWLNATDDVKVATHLEPAVIRQEAQRIATGILADGPSQAVGSVDQTVVEAIVRSESSGDPEARNPNSTATGLGQFTNGTWLETIRKHRPDLAGETDAEVLALRTDPALSREMIGHYAADNAESLRRQGIDAAPANLMLAHRFGAGGAAAILGAEPTTPIGQVVGREVMEANQDLAGKTAGDLVYWAGGRMAAAQGGVPSRDAALIAKARSIPNPRLAQQVEAFVRSGLAEQEHARREADRHAEQERARALSDLELRLSRGQADLPDIEQAYAAGGGWLKPHDRTRLTLSLEERQRKQAETMAEFGRVAAAVSGEGVLDPKSDRDRKAVDVHFAGVAGAWKDMPAEDVATQIVSWSNRYGMVPSAVRSNLRGSLRRPDKPEAVVQAADMLERLRNANPEILKDFAQEDIALGNLVSTYTGYGMPPVEAVRLATEAGKVPESDRLARRQAYRQAVEAAPAASSDYLRDNLVGGWFARHLPFSQVPNLSPPTELVSEFDRVATDEFARHGVMDAARKTALDTLRRVWGISTVGGLSADAAGASGGARLMRHAPELFYGRPALSAEANGQWMREQLLSDLQSDGGIFDGAAGSLEDRFMLVADPSRRDPKNGGPLYQIHLRRRDGGIEVVRGADQTPRLWRPDWETSPAGQRQAKRIDGLRATREFRSGPSLGSAVDQAIITAADPNMGAR